MTGITFFVPGPARVIRRRTLALLSGSALAVAAPHAFAQSVLPSGGAVVSGRAAISSPSASSLLITQSSRNAIINWGSFSLGAGTDVRFENGTGATLNRVTGFSPSQIDGSLSASGSLYLVNPNGITVGPTGQVTTGGSFVASTLDVSGAEFNAGGAMTFRGSSPASVINYGTIGALGGDVALIARQVENAGTITAPNGTVGLAAGYEVLVRDAALSDGKFVVKVGGADTRAKTSGVIKAAEVELKANGGNVYALAGNTDSITKATGVSSKGGRIFLTAGDGGTVTVGQKVSARAAASGGKAKGGQIRVSGGTAKVSGKLDAAGEGDAGGTIVVTGRDITLANGASLDASGTTGGTVLVGGDYQGGYDATTKYLAEDVATAQTVSVDAGAAIHVDGTAGAGGRAVVWSDAETTFNGTITATGAGSGNGGQVETSGHVLSLGSEVFISTLAEKGATGTWLIDPYNVLISTGASSNVSDNQTGSTSTWTPIASGSTINTNNLEIDLATSNVIVQTNGAGSEAGNIFVVAPITWGSGNTLTLNADATSGGIVIDASIRGLNSASSLVLSAGAGGIFQTAAISAGTVTATATNGGSVHLANGANLVSTLGASSAAGSFTFTSGRALTVSGPIASDGTLSLTTTSGDLTVNVALADSHANSSLTLSAAGSLIIARDITQSGSGAALSLSSGSGYALTNGARVSLPDSGASLSVNGQAYTLIHDASALQSLGASGFYALGNDIDASATASWNGGAGFAPVGTLATPFSGTFAGLGHFIDSLAINRPGTNVIGLFGAANGAILRDFTLSNVAVTGQARVGAVVGDAFGSNLSNIHVTGRIAALQDAGGIAGTLGDSTLSNSSSAASVSATGDSIGGLAGYAYYASTISNSYATGAVSGANNVGGLIGRSLAGSPLALTNVYASGRVTGTSGVGGFIGEIDSSSVNLANAYWDSNSSGQPYGIGSVPGATVSGTLTDIASAPRTQSSYNGFDFASTWVLIAGETRPMLRSEYSTVIATPAALQLMSQDLSASYTLGANLDMASALAAGAGGYYGGLWGASGFVPVGNGGSQFTGSFNGQGHAIAGLAINRGGTDYVGLFGYTSGATVGNVTLSGGSIIGRDDVGPLIGYMMGGSVSSASASATVSGQATGEANTGGLIGAVNGGAVSGSSASGSVTGAGYQIGGLVGYLTNGGTITQSHATGSVTGTSTSAGNGYVGGLVGANGFSGDGGTISQSYAAGTVTGISGPIGGFVGHNEGTITDSYATGRVVGLGTASNIGGFVGVNYVNGIISNAYSTGYVTGTATAGGFAGYNNNSASAITNAYWDTQTSGQSTGIAGGSGSATARTTAQLQGSLPAGFSSSIWGTGTNLYPYFTWRYSTTPVAISGIAYWDTGTTALAGTTVTGLSAGSALGSAVSGANGYYYILTPASALAATGVMTYLDNGAAKGAAFSDIIGTNGVQNVSIYGTAVHVITGATTLTATQANYLAARGSYADSDLSFLSSASFAPLTLSAGYGVYLNAAGNYALDANLGASGPLTIDSGGAFSVSGAVTLSAAGALTVVDAVSWSDASSLTLSTTGGGNISLGGTVSGTAGSLVIAGSGMATSSSAVDVSVFRLTGGTWSQVAATLPAFAATNFVLGSGTTFLRATGGNGAAATPYQIADLYGLQGLASSSLLAQNFVLVDDINAAPSSGWNAGAGFLSIGDATTAFTGSLDGAGHTISGLAVNRPTISAGLFGTIGGGGSVSNLTVAGAVSGLDTGLLAGANGGTVSNVTTSGSVDNDGAASAGALGGIAGTNSGTITGSSSSATVSTTDASAAGGLVGTNTGTVSASFAQGVVQVGDDGRAGGLVGYNSAGTISGSLATGAVTAGFGITGTAGGLVGVNSAAITNSYATGNITGGATAGGLVGVNSGTVANSYASGTLPSAAAPYGGLIGNNAGTVTASFWNTTTSGTGLGVGVGSASGATGLSSTQMTSLSTFTAAGWDVDDAGGTSAVWRIYDGFTAPLLRGFMAGLTVTGGNGTKTYDGSATSTDVGTLVYSPAGYTTALVSGTAAYTASSADAGTYSGAGLKLSGLYSSQFGYDMSFVSGTLVVTRAALTVTANDAGKAFDGAAYSGGNGVTYSGFVGSDTAASLGGTLAYGGTAQGAVNVGSYSITVSGLTSANYSIAYAPGALTISPAALTVTANAQTMHYGNAVPTPTYGITSGALYGGDTLTGALATPASSTSGVGTYAITQGTLAASSNYALTYVGANVTVTPRPITVTADAKSMIYGDAVPALTY
ncbi:GLUG motif-containing protein, partial [Xanthobacter sp. V2C-4]